MASNHNIYSSENIEMDSMDLEASTSQETFVDTNDYILAKLFNKHLLLAKQLEVGYSYKNIKFQYVYLFGIVNQIIPDLDGKTTMLIVDDGTASIPCSIQDNDSSTLIRNYNSTAQELRKKQQTNKSTRINDPFLPGLFLLFKKSCSILKKMDFNKLKLGDRVRIIGRLSSLRWIYINQIEINNELNSYIDYLNGMMQLYENDYSESDEETEEISK